MKPLTPTQANVLDILRKLPARKRVGGEAGGTIPLVFLESYHADAITALVTKGYAIWNDYGLKLVEK